MKLTKDLMEDWTESMQAVVIRLHNDDAETTINQILKNQEDAEKWREHDKEYCNRPTTKEILQNDEIVERLKKRIEELRMNRYDWSDEIVIELQKILVDHKPKAYHDGKIMEEKE